MSRLVTIMSQVANISARWHRIHDDTFGFSRLRLARTSRLAALYAARQQELEDLSELVTKARDDLAGLGEQDLSIRRGVEVQETMSTYLQALAKSMDTLHRIVALQCDEAGTSSRGNARMPALKMEYDDAVQFQKRICARLNQLASEL